MSKFGKRKKKRKNLVSFKITILNSLKTRLVIKKKTDMCLCVIKKPTLKPKKKTGKLSAESVSRSEKG